MITSISTNFGVNPISLKCYDSERIVVLQGMFALDTSNEDYLAAEQLEITFPDQFSIPASKPTTAFLVCQKDDLQSGTIIKAQLQGNKLILEKLSIYDGIGTVKVVLASGFVGDASEALLSPHNFEKGLHLHRRNLTIRKLYPRQMGNVLPPDVLLDLRDRC